MKFIKDGFHYCSKPIILHGFPEIKLHYIWEVIYLYLYGKDMNLVWCKNAAFPDNKLDSTSPFYGIHFSCVQ